MDQSLRGGLVDEYTVENFLSRSSFRLSDHYSVFHGCHKDSSSRSIASERSVQGSDYLIR